MTASTQLSASAASLRRQSLNIEQYSEGNLDIVASLFFNLHGPAPHAAAQQLAATTRRLSPVVHATAQAAGILEDYAPLFHDLERLESLERFSETAAAWAAPAAEALDWLCATQIDRLCTPRTPEPPQRLEDFANLSVDAIHELVVASAPPEAQRLAELNTDVRLLEAGPGRVVALVDASPSPPGTAPASITTFVPGVGSANPDTWDGQIERARRLSAATGGPAIAWIGYTAPPSVPHGIAREPARAGGKELARFQRGIAKRWPHAQHIVVGYSYGSVVTGYAARAGMRADDVVLVGSPGVGHTSASTIPGRVWAVTNRDDPISWATGSRGGIHGPEPAEPEFGARPLPGAGHRPGDHSSYWDDPAFYRGMREIAQR